MPLVLTGAMEEDSAAWAPSGLCGLIGAFNIEKFFTNTDTSGLRPVQEWKDFQHQKDFKDVNQMGHFVDHCLFALDSYNRTLYDGSADLDNAIVKLKQIRSSDMLTAPVASYLAHEEFITILTALLAGFPLYNIYMWVQSKDDFRRGGDHPYRLCSYISDGGTLRIDSPVSLNLYNKDLRGQYKSISGIHIGLSGCHYGPIRTEVKVPEIMEEDLLLLLAEHAAWKPAAPEPEVIQAACSDDEDVGITTTTPPPPTTTTPTTTPTTTTTPAAATTGTTTPAAATPTTTTTTTTTTPTATTGTTTPTATTTTTTTPTTPTTPTTTTTTTTTTTPAAATTGTTTPTAAAATTPITKGGYLGKKMIALPPRRGEFQLLLESQLLHALDWKSHDLGRSVCVKICGVTRALKRFAAVISTRRYSLYTSCEDFGLPQLHNLYHMDVAVFAHDNPGVLVSMTYLRDIVDAHTPARVCVRSWLTACGKVKVVHCDVTGGDFSIELAQDILNYKQCDLVELVPNIDAILAKYKTFCHTGKLQLEGNHSRDGWVTPDGTPKGHLCVPSMDVALGGSFDCSSWDAAMFNVVYCNMELVCRHMDHVLLKNCMSDIGRFWFAFGRSSPQSSVWLSDTDWVIFDYWSKSLIRTGRFEDLTFQPAPEVPLDLVTSAHSVVHDYYTRCLSHGKWHRLSNDPKTVSSPASTLIGKSGAGSGSDSERKRGKSGAGSESEPEQKRSASTAQPVHGIGVPVASREVLLNWIKEKEQVRGTTFASWKRAYNTYANYCKKCKKKALSYETFNTVRMQHRPDLNTSDLCVAIATTAAVALLLVAQSLPQPL
jgi:hypothetical protein